MSEPGLFRSTFGVLRHSAFRAVWLGALVSNVGNWMETIAQAWLVQEQTKSPMLLGLLATAEFLPVALLMLPAGALADRFDRRKLLLGGQVAMMILAGVLALLTHLHLATPAVIIAIAFLQGAAWALVTPAWQALVPAMVPREELPAAIGLNSAQFNTARLFGPMIAGAILTAGGAALAFDLNTVSFVGIVVVLGLIQIPGSTPEGPPKDEHPLQGVIEAIRWVRSERGPRRLVLGLTVFGFFVAPVQGLMAAYADGMQVGPWGYGRLLACLGGGALFGALTLARAPRTIPRHRLIPLAMLCFSLCSLTYALSPWFWLSGTALAIGGVFWVWSLASSSTAMQLLAPDRIRGRAMSVLSLATMGPLPLGHLIGGAVASWLGVRVAVAGMASLLACFAVWSVIAREPAIDSPALVREPV